MNALTKKILTIVTILCLVSGFTLLIVDWTNKTIETNYAEIERLAGKRVYHFLKNTDLYIQAEDTYQKYIDSSCLYVNKYHSTGDKQYLIKARGVEVEAAKWATVASFIHDNTDKPTHKTK